MGVLDTYLANLDWDKVRACTHLMGDAELHGHSVRMCAHCGVIPAQVEPDSVLHTIPDFFAGKPGVTHPKTLAARGEQLP